MEKSMAEGSQTFEEALARLIADAQIDPQGRYGYADSLHQPDVAPAKRFFPGRQRRHKPRKKHAMPRTIRCRSPRSCWTSSRRHDVTSPWRAFVEPLQEGVRCYLVEQPLAGAATVPLSVMTAAGCVFHFLIPHPMSRTPAPG